MSFVSDLSQSSEYLSFRSSIPLRKIVVDSDNSKAWKIFDSGPRSVSCPLVLLGPACGTADTFYQQVSALAARGVRVISAEPPPYWSIKEWCDGFKRLIDYLELDKVHLFGASLGGYLALKFAESSVSCPRVASLVLCNAFVDAGAFGFSDSCALFWLLPALVLKRMLLGNFVTDDHAAAPDRAIALATDFMVERLESLGQAELASRLTLNVSGGAVVPSRLQAALPVTVVDVWDECALSGAAREELLRTFPAARRAHLKSGGNFPYLSRAPEVNLHLLLHLRQFDGTEVAASYVSLLRPLSLTPATTTTTAIATPAHSAQVTNTDIA